MNTSTPLSFRSPFSSPPGSALLTSPQRHLEQSALFGAVGQMWERRVEGCSENTHALIEKNLKTIALENDFVCFLF